MKNIISFVIICLSVSVSVYSQEAQDTTHYSIISTKEKLLLRTQISTQNEIFSIINEDERYSIEASNLLKLQLAANYKFIGLSVSFSPNNKNSDFVSSFLESNLDFFVKEKWIQSFHYSRVRGFYLESQPIDLDKQFPNLKTTNYYGATAYNYNPNFSLKHLLHHNEWQKKSAGSLVPSLKYGYNRISDIVDNEKIAQNNFDLALSIPYYYTWCFKKHWFISPNISPALGIRFSSEKTLDDKSNESYLIRSLNVGLQYGYTSEKISAGVKFNFDSNSVNNKFTREFINDKNYATLYFAYRLEPPGFLKRGVDKINEKLGLE